MNTTTLQKILAIFITILSVVLGTTVATEQSCEIEHEIQYIVDRVEKGAQGENWIVLEVYDATTDSLNYINIKVEEGYKVNTDY